MQTAISELLRFIRMNQFTKMNQSSLVCFILAELILLLPQLKKISKCIKINISKCNEYIYLIKYKDKPAKCNKLLSSERNQ